MDFSNAEYPTIMSYPLGTFTAHHPLNWSPAQIDTLTEFQFSHPVFLSYVRKQQQQQQQQLHGGAGAGAGAGATKKAIDFTDLTIPPALLHDLGFTLLTATTTNFVGERILPIVETGVRDVLGKMWRETSGMIRASSSQGPRAAQQMVKKEEASDDHFTLSTARDYTIGNYYGGKMDGGAGGGKADKFAGYGYGKVGESSRQLRSNGSAKEEAYKLWQAQAKGNGMEEKGKKKGKEEQEEEVEEEEALLAENLAENAALDQQLSEMVARIKMMG
ncbi:hypothetical protein LZ554_004356 [Drepanopeziza brunnea f. sp. 'monogermtubi']|nr:hypothetical protein LZ554_004356 [Drepanopeziza brunnea f. sp. 'monogermtubi']